MAWKRIAGGTLVSSQSEYRCDEEFENTVTGERRRFASTDRAHDIMPQTVDSIEEITSLAGVKEWPR